MKVYKRISTRYEKLALTFLNFIFVAAVFDWLKIILKTRPRKSADIVDKDAQARQAKLALNLGKRAVIENMLAWLATTKRPSSMLRNSTRIHGCWESETAWSI